MSSSRPREPPTSEPLPSVPSEGGDDKPARAAHHPAFIARRLSSAILFAVAQARAASTAPDAHLLDEEFHRDLNRAMRGLSRVERRVLTQRFGLGSKPSRTLAKVGARLGLSRQRVQQIERRALERLRLRPAGQFLVKWLR